MDSEITKKRNGEERRLAGISTSRKRISETELLFCQIFDELGKKTRIMESERFIQHGTTSVLLHSVAVALFACAIADAFFIRVDRAALIRGALLHDYFLYDWHHSDNDSHNLHGFRHPYFALSNAIRDFSPNAIEIDIIEKHMFPLTPFLPKYRESVIVCLADKVCSTYETLRQEKHMVTFSIARRLIREAGKCRPELSGRQTDRLAKASDF